MDYKKFNTLIIFVYLGILPVYVSAGINSIPKQFHGTWAEPEGCKTSKEVGSPPDVGAEINSTRVDRYEYPCTLKKTKESSKTKFSGQYTCSSPDGDSSETISLSFVGKGKLSINGEAAVPKCK